MIPRSDQLFKAGEEEEELTVYSRGLNYAHSEVDIWTKVWFLFFLSNRNRTNLGRTAARGSVWMLLFCLFVQNERLHKWSLVQSRQVFAHNGQTDGLFGKRGGGVAASSRPARVQGFPSPSLCSLIGSALWDSRKDSHTARHCNRRQSLIVSTAADLAASLQSSAHQYALD